MGARRTLNQPVKKSKYYLSQTYLGYKPFIWSKTTKLSQINYLSNLLQNNQNTTISRFNDGEWAYALNIDSLKLSPMKERNKGYEDELNYAASKLLKIIKSIPEYYISVDKISLTDPLSKDIVQTYVDNFNFIGSGIFNHWSLYTGFQDLFEVFNQRKTVVIGPEMLNALPFSFYHYKLPLKGVNYEIDKYTKEIEEYINTIWEPNMVIIYSCSFLAKISLDNLYKKYGDSITQLDIGASLNPFIGYSNRPWHGTMIWEIKEKQQEKQKQYLRTDRIVKEDGLVYYQKVYKYDVE